ncbi:hypothetical protein IFM89_023053 [Coptis chinensis]|uniref:Aminotransferase-like plant mobile domain-containing protein n=1 Tax=Coptis chinensis TaxID=261450 RepID=A0A835IXY8_9MAGN|nr:hypothetical protein IFM89_023053 [Coptis chinensis]
MPPKTRGAKASQVQPSATKLSRANKQPQTASFCKNHNRRKRDKNVIEEEIPSVSFFEEENFEESNSIDSQEGVQEYSDKTFILSLKKKKEKAKGPDVREEYPKEGSFPGGPTTMIDDRDSILRGEALVGKVNIKKAYAKQLLVQGLSLAVTEAEIDEKLDDCGGAGKAMSLGWLSSKLAGKENSKDSEIIDNCVRGYFLLLLGCVLFPNKSGDKIFVAYMKFLLNLEKVKDYAWALVEAWVYEHFPCFWPPYNSKCTIDMPLMKRWLVGISTGDIMTSLVSVREELDELEARDVTWDPYRDVRASFSFDEVLFFSGYLCCLDDLAAYHLDQWFNHVLNETMRGTDVVDSSYCNPKYIELYYSVNHPRVQNPVRCSGLFKRVSMVARPTYDELNELADVMERSQFKALILFFDRRSYRSSSVPSHLMLTEHSSNSAHQDFSYIKSKEHFQDCDGWGSAIAQITEAYQILKIDDSSASSASKDPVYGSSASSISKDPVHDSSVSLYLQIWLVVLSMKVVLRLFRMMAVL